MKKKKEYEYVIIPAREEPFPFPNDGVIALTAGDRPVFANINALGICREKESEDE